MGVKSTQYISREAAEEKYVDLILSRPPSVREQIRSIAKEISDKDLEDILEVMNDAVNGGEGFANYIIGEEHA